MARAVKIGGLAQLGERLHGMQEVIGSSPLSSISESLKYQVLGAFFVDGFCIPFWDFRFCIPR